MHELVNLVEPELIDYILPDGATHQFRHRETCIHEDLCSLLATDHCALVAEYALWDVNSLGALCLPRPTPVSPTYNRWSHDGDQSAWDNFRNILTTKVYLSDDRRINVSSFTNIVYTTSQECGRMCSSRTVPASKKQVKTEEESSLLQSRRVAETRDERSNLTKQIWRLRKKERRVREQLRIADAFANVDGSKPVIRRAKRHRRMTTYQTTEVTIPLNEHGLDHGNPLPCAEGVQQVAALFDIYFRRLYLAGIDTYQFRWVWNRQRSHQAVANSCSIFTVEKLDMCIDKLNRNSTPGGDNLVTDLLRALPPVALECLRTAFQRRFLGWSDRHQTWHDAKVTLLEKRWPIRTAADFRPICVQSILHKLYMSCIRHGCPQLFVDLPEEFFAFRKGYQTSDELHTLKQIIEKTNEWDVPLAYCRSDLLKAFDRVQFSVIVEAFDYFRVPRCVSAAIIREWMSLRCIYRWGDVSSSSIGRLRGIPQGDSISPHIFNIVMCYLLQPLLDKCRANRGGFHFIRRADGHQPISDHVGLLVFADDLVLIGTSVSEIQSSLDDLVAVLEPGGLALDPSKTEWSHNLALPCVGLDAFQALVRTDLAESQQTLALANRHVKSSARTMRSLRGELATMDSCPIRSADWALLSYELSTYAEDFAHWKRVRQQTLVDQQAIFTRKFSPSKSVSRQPLAVSR